MSPSDVTRRSLLASAAGAAAGLGAAGPLARAAAAAAGPVPDHRLGFRSVEREISVGALEVDGRLPSWLAGTLVRNGPGRYEVGERTFEHWFDGLAMLHAFSFRRGRVSYANRFLRSSAYEAATRDGRIAFNEFATDPCRAIFNGAQAVFQPPPVPNGNVNVAALGERFVAMTELPLPVRFDPRTLRTLGVRGTLQFGVTGTAHPHRTRSGRTVTYETSLIPPSAYVIKAGGRELARIPAARPAYMHSFALTERHAILTEAPFTVDPLKLATDWEPFIRNFRWNGSEPTRLHVVSLATGRVRATLETDPLFTFHHVNAHDAGDDRIVMDLLAYRDPSVIDELYLARLRRAGRHRVPVPRPRRLELDLGRSRVRSRELWDGNMELPRVAYGAVNARPYRWMYGVGVRDERKGGFLDQLVKLDVRTGETRTWRERGCYPGEAVLVRAPGARREDDGVALSVVLDARRRTSFLLVLDARTFTERARAEVPQPVPFGFHGEVFRPR